MITTSSGVLLVPSPSHAKSLGAPLRLVLLCTLLGLSLGGCGRRGALEPPGGAAAASGGQAAATPGATPTISPLGQAKTRNPPITPPKTPFILDPIL
jgi:hypothetical protein